MVLVHKGGDNTPRWRPGERLNHLFEARCDMLSAAAGDGSAVLTPDGPVGYRELDARANQLARHLVERGVAPGDRIALLFDRSVETYVALLAAMKADAAYVPLDPGFPRERIAYILADSGATVALTLSAFAPTLAGLPVKTILLDAERSDIERHATARLEPVANPAGDDPLCYVIYTSGTTGNPKGVAVRHSSICNFVRVAAEVYGIRPEDRVYQGMTIAFDFSVEELWVPLMAGATLAPAPPGASLVGEDLADFLRQAHVTALCCVPTLLATIETELPDLRLLLLSGEACPQNLVTRWHRPGRTLLNVYGPTEATVTATITELAPDKAVTIGGPLPTYAIVMLDPDKDAVVAAGEAGEIGIAGIGLAEGYLNRSDLTAAKFIADFLAIPHNPSGRIYRTGDLGRINVDSEIEYLGRIDTQVKIRGYRIELTEIESQLMQMPEIAQAVVDKFEPEPGAVELVAFYALKRGAADLAAADILESLRSRLPCYMVPAYIEKLPFIPLTTSNKADRKSLPRPKGPRISGGGIHVAPRNGREALLAAALAAILKVDRVSVEDHFFRDLGAHSLLMARFCSAVRKAAGGADIAMRDVYLHPTIARLAEHLSADVDPAEPVAERPATLVPSDLAYLGCGALQLAFYLAYGLFTLWIVAAGLEWAHAASHDGAAHLIRLTAVSAALFFGLSVLPLAAKWLLIGRFRAESFPIWGLRYFRFWAVKALIHAAPVNAFRGTPLFNLYLRLLGARIGRGVVILARHVPVTADLFAVGDDTVLSSDAVLPGYKAEAGRIHIGPIAIGRNAYVGGASVVDIGTAMEDGAQLGHASSLQGGQRVPAGKRFHGSPAVETTVDYRMVEDRPCGAARRWLYTAGAVAPALALGPALVLIAYEVFPYLYDATSSHEVMTTFTPQSALIIAAELAAASLLLFVASLAASLGATIAGPRILNRLIVENRTYPLFGFHYTVYRLMSGLGNSRFLNLLFGDSSYIVHYLKAIGWNLNRVHQTGSNFGSFQKQDNPLLCEVGAGSMISDGLSMNNAEISHCAFRLTRLTIGARNYLGNNILFPVGARTGDNMLLATKVMVPIDGPPRENVGLLGSPCFAIPRVASTDRQAVAALGEPARLQLLRRKNRFNLRTMAWFALNAWLLSFVGLAGSYLSLLAYPRYGLAALGAAALIILAATIAISVFGEWASLRFRRLSPRTTDIYDKHFWMHERSWKFSDSPLQYMFRGTPFRNVISRLTGVKIGRKVFDDGCNIVGKSLIELGDYCNLNEESVLQAHSLEEGVFKSDMIRLGAGCTIGAQALVHYGVVMGDGVILDPDSFLMKGETLEAGSIWRGNPARAIRQHVRPEARAAGSGLQAGVAGFGEAA